jgi:hypothetical protein
MAVSQFYDAIRISLKETEPPNRVTRWVREKIAQSVAQAILWQNQYHLVPKVWLSTQRVLLRVLKGTKG